MMQQYEGHAIIMILLSISCLIFKGKAFKNFIFTSAKKNRLQVSEILL